MIIKQFRSQSNPTHGNWAKTSLFSLSQQPTLIKYAKSEPSCKTVSQFNPDIFQNTTRNMNDRARHINLDSSCQTCSFMPLDQIEMIIFTTWIHINATTMSYCTCGKFFEQWVFEFSMCQFKNHSEMNGYWSNESYI